MKSQRNGEDWVTILYWVFVALWCVVAPLGLLVYELLT